MDSKVIFSFLLLVSVVAYSQKGPQIELFKTPTKNNFALNVPDNMLLDDHRIFKDNLTINPSEDGIIPKKKWNDMPIFEPSSDHSTPIFPIDSTRTHFIKIYPSNRMHQ